MNKVILVGRLARDPELRTTNTGRSMCRFAVAVDRRRSKDNQSNQPTADFINVVAWDRQAEVINQYLSKGRQIALSGRLSTGSYTAQDGSKRYTTDVMLDEFDFIGGNGGNGNYNQGGYNQSQGYAPAQPAGNSMPLNGPLDLADDDFHLLAEDDDVPF